MDPVRQYLLSLMASAIICATVKSVTNEKTFSGGMIRLIAGIIMTLTVLSPVMLLDIDDLPSLTAELTADAEAAAAAGKEMADAEMKAIIIRQTQAYILDKAADYGAALDAEVIMPQDGSPQPVGVIISGSVSPYAKAQLQKIIADDIQISKENQQWIS